MRRFVRSITGFAGKMRRRMFFHSLRAKKIRLATLRFRWPARGQGKECGHSTEEEICILLLHGVLHLLGMDHETDNGAMGRAELRWRRKLGLPAGLIERAGR